MPHLLCQLVKSKVIKASLAILIVALSALLTLHVMQFSQSDCIVLASLAKKMFVEYSGQYVLLYIFACLRADQGFASQADAQGPEDKITFCQDCGNNVHVECFKRWTASKKSSGQPVTCVYCRCPWVSETGMLILCLKCHSQVTST